MVAVLEVELLELLSQLTETGVSMAEADDPAWALLVAAAQQRLEGAGALLTELLAEQQALEGAVQDGLRGVTETASVLCEAVACLRLLSPCYQYEELAIALFAQVVPTAGAEPVLDGDALMVRFLQHLMVQLRGLLLGDDYDVFAALVTIMAGIQRRTVSPSFLTWLNRGSGSGTTAAPNVSDWAALDAAAGTSTIVPWLQPLAEMVDKIARARPDWQAWREGPEPERAAMPNNIHTAISASTHVMLTATLRPGRLAAALRMLEEPALGVQLPHPAAAATSAGIATRAGGISGGGSLAQALAEAGCRTPTFVLQAGDPSEALLQVLEHSAREGRPAVQLPPGEADNEAVLAVLATAMTAGSHLVVVPTGAAHSRAICTLLCTRLRYAATTDVDTRFRLIIVGSSHMPVPDSLLRNVIHCVIQTPGGFREQLAFAVAQLSAELLAVSHRAEWIPLLHNICFLHSVLCTRATFGEHGWFGVYSFSASDLHNVVAYAKHLYAGSDVSNRITNLRMYTDLVYGRHITNAQDRKLLSLLVGKWITSAATKSNFCFQGEVGGADAGDDHGYHIPMEGITKMSRASAFGELAARIMEAAGLASHHVGALCGVPDVSFTSMEVHHSRYVDACGLC